MIKVLRCFAKLKGGKWRKLNGRNYIIHHEVLLELTIKVWASSWFVFKEKHNRYNSCIIARFKEKNVLQWWEIVSKAWKERKREQNSISYRVSPCQMCVCVYVCIWVSFSMRIWGHVCGSTKGDVTNGTMTMCVCVVWGSKKAIF